MFGRLAVLPAYHLARLARTLAWHYAPQGACRRAGQPASSVCVCVCQRPHRPAEGGLAPGSLTAAVLHLILQWLQGEVRVFAKGMV